jgi:hypothetical protein
MRVRRLIDVETLTQNGTTGCTPAKTKQTHAEAVEQESRHSTSCLLRRQQHRQNGTIDELWHDGPFPCRGDIFRLKMESHFGLRLGRGTYRERL